VSRSTYMLTPLPGSGARTSKLGSTLLNLSLPEVRRLPVDSPEHRLSTRSMEVRSAASYQRHKVPKTDSGAGQYGGQPGNFGSPQGNTPTGYGGSPMGYGGTPQSAGGYGRGQQAPNQQQWQQQPQPQGQNFGNNSGFGGYQS
jgi:hypothetical protein